MNLYQRVASGNPSAAKSVINRFGYEIKTRDLAFALKQLVSAEGEPALRAIVEIHPDKEVILECFQPSAPDKVIATNDLNNSFLNAAGNMMMSEAQKQAQLTNTFLVASCILILGALILKNQ